MHYNILIHKYLTGVISTPETEELNNWLSRDPENRQQFEEIKQIWLHSKEDEGAPPSDEQMDSDLQILERAIEESARREDIIERNRIRNRYKNGLIGILSLIAIALFGWIFQDSQPASGIYVRSTQNDELIYSDSSRVVLNKNSSLFVNMTSEVREATLSGEGFFQITKDKRPFFVHAGAVTLRVLGTSFIVKNEAGFPVEVYVISGRISLAYQGLKEQLSAGEMATVDANSGIQKYLNDDPNFNSWYTRDLVFNKAELREVLSALRKHYNVMFHVTNTQVLDCRFTGKFQDARIDDIIEILSYSLNIKFQLQKKDNYEVSGKGCK